MTSFLNSRRMMLLSVSGIALSPFGAGVAMAQVTPADVGVQGQAPAGAGAQADGAQADAAQADAAQADTASEIIVTGRRAAIQSADRRKANSDTITDSVLADDAGKLPDNSLTEVLQRVPGVTITRFAAVGDPDNYSAEGSGIQVRGLSGVAGRLNGREVFSANSGRGLSFGDITPELMAALDVYKASTADLIEGGTGGQVDLRTKMPFDYKKKLTVVGSAGVSYGDLSKKDKYNGSILVSGRIDSPIGEIGLLVDYARNDLATTTNVIRAEPYFRTNVQGTDRYIPGGFDYGEYINKRTRTGLYGALQWKPASNLEISAIFFQSKYKDSSLNPMAFVQSKTLSVDPAKSVFDANGGLVSSTSLFAYDTTTLQPSNSTLAAGGAFNYAEGSSRTTDISVPFKWRVSDRVRISGAAQYVNSVARQSSYALFNNIPGFPTPFGLDLSGSLPKVSFPAGTSVPLDPAAYVWSASMDHQLENRGKEYAGNADIEMDLSDSGFFRTLKAGVRYSDRSERDNNTAYNWQAFGMGWNGSPVTSFAQSDAGDYQQYDFSNFFRGATSLPASVLLPSAAMAERFDVAGDHDKYGNPIQPIGFSPITLGTVDTQTLDAYALVRFEQDNVLGMKLQGNVGARIVDSKNSSAGFFQQNSTQFNRDGQLVTLATVGSARGGSRSYRRVLPSINVQVLPTPDVHIRAGYNITLDNPSFDALRATGTLSVTTAGANGAVLGTFQGFTTDSGNPLLKPAISNNFDLSAEWYPKSGTELHASAFHKTIQNALIYGATSQTITVQYSDGTSSLEPVTSNNYSNATLNAKINGVEVGGRTFLDMLPGVFSGLGVEANYTFIQSKNPGDSYLDINGVRRSDVPLAGLSKHNFNVAGLYEKGWLSARVAYSWRSRYLLSTNSSGTNGTYVYYGANGLQQTITFALPVYSEPYGQVDAGVTIKFNKFASLSLQGQNLSNSTAKTSMGGYANDARYIRSWFVADRRYSATVTFQF